MLYTGARVSNTAVKDAVDVDLYVNDTNTFGIGNLAAMCGKSMVYLIFSF